MLKITPPPNDQVSPLKAGTKVAEKDLGPIPGQYIVVFKDQWGGQINRAIGQQVLEFVNTRIDEFGIADSVVKSRYEHALRGFTATLTDRQLKALKSDERVKFVEQDFRFKAASSVDGTSPIHLNNSAFGSQTIPWGIARVDGPLDGTGKKAWVLDSGIDLDHADLNVDVNNSVSFVNGESADDLFGHGTYTAGILAAKDNSIDVAGVAAGATVVSVKVLNRFNAGTVAGIVAGVNYVAGKAFQVI